MYSPTDLKWKQRILPGRAARVPRHTSRLARPGNEKALHYNGFSRKFCAVRVPYGSRDRRAVLPGRHKWQPDCPTGKYGRATRLVCRRLYPRAGNSHDRVSVCVCLSVCESHAVIVSKRLNIYDRRLTEINVIDIFCALNLRIKFWYLLF